MKKTAFEKLIIVMQFTTALMMLSKEVLSMLYYVKHTCFSDISDLLQIISILYNAVR